MSIVRWNPSRPAGMSRIFDDFFNSELWDWSRNNFAAENATLPAINVRETDDDYRIEVAAPGMNKNDFNIELNNGLLTLSATKESSDEKKENNYTRKEFSYASFRRSFRVPDSVHSDKIEAAYTDGILHVTLPKKPEAKPQPVKRITIA